MHAEPKGEPFDIRMMRHIFRRWPFLRGKGVLLKAFRPLLRDREFVCEVVDGVVVLADLSDWITLHGLVEGYDREFAMSWAFIRPGDTVIDVGANIGIWTIAAAKKTGQQGQVHAFEPLEANFGRLLHNIDLNAATNVVPQKLALSDRAGPRRFFPSPNMNSGVGRLVTDDWTGLHSTVEAVTLDDYCDQHGITSVNVLKIDVEGAEYFVLKGATRLLRSSDPPIIVFEMNREMAADLGSSPDKIETFLAALGYSIFGYRGGKLNQISLCEFFGHEDLFALPKHANRSLES